MTLKFSVYAKVIMAGAVKQNTMPDKYISKRIFVGHHSYLNSIKKGVHLSYGPLWLP